jgi:YesN/AraC family two-component response regulator
LIIEDDWELRNYLASEFKDRFIIYTASNGSEGLEKAINKLPDLIISDVMMPEMDGFEFCKSMRADLRVSHTPVILLTAKAMAENMVEGYKSGADLYVSKPFDKDILLSQIQSLLNNRDLLKKRYSHDLGIKIEDITHSDSDEKLLHKAISIVEMNIQNTQFDVNRFVEELGIGRTLAYKKIKVLSGKSINDFILSVRLQKAGTLLKKTEKTVAEIALEVGFSDHSYFSAVFKKQFNTSPTSFRKSHLNQ